MVLSNYSRRRKAGSVCHNSQHRLSRHGIFKLWACKILMLRALKFYSHYTQTYMLSISYSLSFTSCHPLVKEKEKKLDFSSIEWYNTTEAFLSDVLIIHIWLAIWKSLAKQEITKVES